MKPTSKCLMRGAVLAIGLVVGLGVVGFGLVPLLHADEPGAGAQTGRAVRLSNVDGQVQLSQGGQMLADHAIVNTPLFEGTQMTTGMDGRAEVQFEDGSTVRIPPTSSLTLSVLRPGGDTEVMLSSGMGYFELQGATQGSPMRVRFGPGVVTATGFTIIRIKLDEGPANMAVFSGNAHLEDSGLVVDLHGGESIAINGGNPSDSSVAESIEPDSWDAWNADRDQALTASETVQTDADKNLPQSNNPAWGDLNANGTWYDRGDQGYIWSPYQASDPGWDPYGTGNWVWTPGYGYVWVSGEPWGYMPYQCGAWNYFDAFGWGWAPGSCQTWWAGGGGGWYYTVATPPRWYKHPVRPGPPKPRNPNPTLGGRSVGPVPFIPVNRPLTMAGGRPMPPLPPRDRTVPVNIGGTVAAPLRPVETRPVYGHQPSTSTGARPVYGTRPENGNGMRPSSQPGADRGGWPPARPAEAPRPSAPPRAPQSSSGPSRPSYGGGGGHSSLPAPSHSSPPPPAGPKK
jgi:hypothetical protein